MNWLTTLSDSSQKVLNTARAIGPFVISQSDKASEAYQRHLGRIAQVEFLKELLSNEIETRGAVRKILLQRYIDAPPEERIRIERDLEFVDGITRQVNVALKSLAYGNNDAMPPNSEIPKPIEDHWIDKFNELARKRNEEWRSNLLARALACEAAAPRTVSPRALWLIGNMEEDLFKALSNLLNLCIWIVPENIPALPHSKIQAYERAIENSDQTVGNLIFQLGDIGVIADDSSFYNPNGNFIVKYDQESYLINPKPKFQIRGVIFTPLGNSIANFFNPSWNANGLSVFKDWIEFISPEIIEVKPLFSPQLA